VRVSETEPNSRTVELISDETLLREFQRGHEWAFDRLVEQHTDRIFSVAWGVMRNRDDAMDVAQEVFVRMYQVLGKFNSSDNLNAWLYRVCLNLCIDRKRRMKRCIVSDLTGDEWDRLYGDSRDEPEFRAIQSESGRAIWDAVGRLPKRQQMVFILRHHNFMSLSEISQTLGCSSGAVKSHLSRATATLRKALRGIVVDIPEERAK
jgi:RNA polymerase sigma-70 factor, ECF subfamily